VECSRKHIDIVHEAIVPVANDFDMAQSHLGRYSAQKD
jgi:hypothetical protein